MANLSNKLQFNILTITTWLYAWFAVRSIWLAFNSIIYSPIFYMFNQIEGYLCIPFGMILLMLGYKSKFTLNKIAILFLPFIYFLLCVFNTYGGWPLGKGIVTLVQISIFIAFNNDIKKSIFNKFYKIIIFTSAVSLIVWGFYQLNIDIGFETVPFYYGEWAYYKKWFIFALYHQATSSSILSDRLCGIFNEPGALGTICALLFVISFKKSKRWEKAVLLSTGALTYSFAFFALLFIFTVIYLSKENVKNIVVAIILLFSIFVIPKIDFHNESINNLAGRFEITESGFAGDNRTNAMFDAQYSAYINTDDVWFGKGAGYSLSDANSSWKSHYMVPFGIVGTTLLLLPWIIISLRFAGKNKIALIYCFIFFVSLYQRPAPIENILGYVLVFGGLSWMNSLDKDGNIK